jgi:hypothetical protein|uniref:Uncharacterized protein n=1 Tax=viral metagenome TaxID=1070528 RepID=A0A6C0CZQ1_9ZZZZ
MGPDPIILNCPYPDCTIAIEVIEINCAIFRCGICKDTGKQIEPHLQKEECDKLKHEDKIWGCGRPFKLVNGQLVCCEYI